MERLPRYKRTWEHAESHSRYLTLLTNLCIGVCVTQNNYLNFNSFLELGHYKDKLFFSCWGLRPGLRKSKSFENAWDHIGMHVVHYSPRVAFCCAYEIISINLPIPIDREYIRTVTSVWNIECNVPVACVQTSPISFHPRVEGNRRRLHAG